ncbi:MAG: hypothetical protein ACO3LE_00660 [Bdellovibrionota bacterium]
MIRSDLNDTDYKKMKSQRQHNRSRHSRKKSWQSRSPKSKRQYQQKLESLAGMAKVKLSVDWMEGSEDDFSYLPALFHFFPELTDKIPCLSLRSCEEASLPTRLQRSQHLFGQNYVFWKEENLDADFLTENVAKKMEFILGSYTNDLKEGQKVIISGFIDNPYVIDLATAASAMKLKPELFFLKSRISRPELIKLLQLQKAGVRCRFFESKSSLEWAFKRQKFYSYFKSRKILDFGGDNNLGALGYLSSLLELSQQPLPSFDMIMLPIDSGISWLGLELGRQLLGWEDTKIVGFSTRHEVGELKVRLANEARALIEFLRPMMDVSWFREFDLSSMMIYPALGQDIEKNLRWMNRFQELEGFDIDLLRVAPALMEAANFLRVKKLNDKKILFWNTGQHVAANEEVIDLSSLRLARAIRDWPKTPDLNALMGAF